MPRKFFRKYLPTHESVRANRIVAAFGGLLDHPNLWHLNRHSVSGGFAVGLFSGLVPGPLQMLTAAIIAIPLRVNLPVALFTTLYTNPITIVPLYFLAFQIGQIVTGTDGQMNPPPDFSWTAFGQYVRAMGEWTLSLGRPLLIGLITLALALATLGWLSVQGIWRLYVVLAWRRRARERSEKQ